MYLKCKILHFKLKLTLMHIDYVCEISEDFYYFSQLGPIIIRCINIVSHISILTNS